MAVKKTIILEVDADGGIKQVDELKQGVKDTNKAAEDSKSSFGKMKGGINAVGVAFKALGIGLIVAAFAKLAEMLGQNQVVMDKLSVVSETVNVVFQKLIQSAIQVGEKLTGAFTSPKDALKSFWEALKQNVVNRVEGLIDLFGALGNVIKGVFTRDLELMKSAAKDAGTAFIQLNTGLDELQQQKAAEGFKNLTKEIKEATKEGVAYGKAITALRNEVKLAEANQRQLQLTYQKDAELQRQIRDDISLTFEERIAANEELGRILDEQFAEEQALAQKKVELAELELSKNADNIDLQVALINAKTEMADLDERITGQRSEQLTNLKALEAERDAAEEERLLKLKEQRLAEESRLALEKEAALLGLEFDKSISDQELQLLIDTENKKLAITKAKIAADKALRVGAAKDILSSIAQLAGEGTAAAKAAALAGILIDTAKGVSGAIAAGAGLPFPLNLGAIATGVASVLAGIVNAKAVLKKVPGGGDGPDPQIDVPTEGGGGGGPEGLNLGAPNIESIEQPEIGQMAPTQAFVVESNISNAQALQQELDLQSTL
tara:strand:- start:951 stop:2603 length:1653 start_codon:yes stop_codon:yes gene_type:complete